MRSCYCVCDLSWHPDSSGFVVIQEPATVIATVVSKQNSSLSDLADIMRKLKKLHGINEFWVNAPNNTQTCELLRQFYHLKVLRVGI